MALPGFRKYFEKASDEHLKRSEMLMTYQNKRGGRIVLQDIETPQRDEWGTGIDAMREAQTLKERLNQSLLELHATADALGDAHMTDFIESDEASRYHEGTGRPLRQFEASWAWSGFVPVR